MNDVAAPAAPNPLLGPWTSAHGLPPFGQFEAAHFKPAFAAALAEHRAEVEAIARQAEAPSFENTVAAFDRAGRLLGRIETLFGTLTSSHTSAELQAVQREMAAPLAAHESAISMNPALFERFDALHREREALGLKPEQLRLLERFHLDFVRAGARLGPAESARYAQLMQELAELHTRFGQNVLADEADFRLLLQGEEELTGLPDFVRAAARQAALDRSVSEGHVITLSRSLILPFLTFSERRDLRERAWRAWTSRGEHEGATDNRSVAREILVRRKEQAALHGHACYADYVLADTMAGSRSAVQGLLGRVWPAALAAGESERHAIVEQMRELGVTHELEAWDWRFYAEKLRQRRYALDETQLKPYFPLEAMVGALFDCAQRLFGLSFMHRADLIGYHPDVKVYEVSRDGQLIGIFLHDNFARPSKRSGAWMNAMRWQARNGRQGGDTLPIILNNNNFAKGAAGEPTLLGYDDVRTLFHEFGHGLHGLLSNVTYERLSGTQVLRDFVELPSQIFEHWMAEPEVLQTHARHYKTGEPIPRKLLDRIKAARNFNQGFDTVRYTASALIDMAIHSLTDEQAPDITTFEAQVLADLGAPAVMGVNHRFPHFLHLFSGSGYAAGYYVYMWAEVLDCDGFDAFTEAGSAFDPTVAKRLLDNVLSVGNSREPGATYRAFRGRDAEVEPMLRERGLA